MQNQPLLKVKAQTAAEICARYSPAKESKALLRDGMTPREFLEALTARGQHVDGIEFVSHALPPREGIWWGALCLQHACPGDLPPAEKAAWSAAVAWVLWPTQSNHAAAHSLAQTAGPGAAAGALAMAADFAATQNTAPMSPSQVANAVKLAAAAGDPVRFADTQRLFVELGIGVAEGRFCSPQG